MASKNAPSLSEVSSMRDIGRSLSDQGFLEIDLVSGHYSWSNDYILSQLGYTFDQLKSMTVFDIIPETFHESLRNVISDQTSGKFHKFSIWPMTSTSGDLVWWYSSKIKSQHPLYWFRCEYLNRTPKFGPEFSSMSAAMQTTNSYNDIYNKLADFQSWTKENVDRLSSETDSLREGIDDIREQVNTVQEQVGMAVTAAKRAADIGLENQISISRNHTNMTDELSKQTAEIFRLISTDVVHAKRIEAFEEHMKKTTAQAVQVIQVQANKAGQDLSRRITIPIGTIAAIATFVQWLIQHWPK